MDQSTAETRLTEEGLTPSYAGEVSTYNSNYGPGQVCQISVSPGTKVAEGTTVQFWTNPWTEPSEPEEPDTGGEDQGGSDPETEGAQ